MVTTRTLSAQRVVLRNISWQTFETMLADMGEDRASRLTYDRGTLEIITPLLPHEYWNRLIERLIFVLGEELNLEILPAGSTTFKREDLRRVAEPDSSYYIQNEARVRNKSEIDLNSDPPPDLVVEIDLTSSSLDKFQIYASLGVPELWRYDEGVLRIYQLQQGQYVECSDSPTFAQLPLNEITRFLEESQRIGVMGMTRNFRNWVREQLATNRN
ncbi:Uma2 family endonuclease [Fischerella sp. PCC 9605]|uniref:Uma2 family endonuclease n=1 Tax=Fischerella sp. PCC 9605 TaxID=1173024 RepID=UPI00047EA14F|nr:Uma2 family endonuclease [Fischerella sp. PCC 9605]